MNLPSSLLRGRFLVRKVVPIANSLPSLRSAFSTSQRTLANEPIASPRPAAPTPKPPRARARRILENASLEGGVVPTGLTMEDAILLQSASALVQVGTRSGRTVKVGKAGVGPSVGELHKILASNKVSFASTAAYLNRRVPPNEQKREKRRKAHYKRFRQGIARFVELALRMKGKTY
jgi:hypothetical protein